MFVELVFVGLLLHSRCAYCLPGIDNADLHLRLTTSRLCRAAKYGNFAAWISACGRREFL
jgi:hypothetical protein